MTRVLFWTLSFTVFLFLNSAAIAAWVVKHQENFDQCETVIQKQWQLDNVTDRAIAASDDSAIESNRPRSSIQPPVAYRQTNNIGESGWLTVESYTRDPQTEMTTLISVVSDPANEQNRVLRLASPQHTDATLIRSSQPLSGQYRISLKVGFANFGDGQGLNGYDGGETAGPWLNKSAIGENGFYWLAIADTIPRPQSNLWWHHHRKVVIDSDNHYPPWMQIWDGTQFITSGRHPVMLFALDGRSKGDALTGKPFISFSHWQWHASGQIRALDAYLPDQWYEVVIERDQAGFTFRISGRFAHGGYRDYVSRIDAQSRCIWHYNRPQDESTTDVRNPECYQDDGPQYARWPANGAWPDYFFFGDPHINYYEGEVYYDDIRLEVWQEQQS